MRKLIIVAIWSALCFSCQQNEKSVDNSKTIIAQAVEAHGGNAYDPLQLDFQFRDKNYIVERSNGFYTYQRIFKDTLGQEIVDILNNDSFRRLINRKEVDVDKEWKRKYGDALNSVIYFGLLPYFLNDAAVKTSYNNTREIAGIDYHEIKVTFQAEGGGTDYEDEYLYWFRTDNYFMDYFAYNYEVDGGGVRFRKAFNPRSIKGIRMQDYVNYKPASKKTPLEDLPDLYIDNRLDSLSLIQLEFD